MKLLHVAFACVVLVCVFVIAAMLVGVGVYFSASRSDMDGISWLRILLLGGFGFWAAAYMSVFAIAFFRKGNLVPESGHEAALKISGARTLTTTFYVLVLIAVVLYPEVFGHFIPILVGLFLFIVVSGFVLVGLHELGHVVAARLVGFRPVSVRVGTGCEWVSFLCGETRVSLGMNVFSGHVQVIDEEEKWTRRRLAVFALGGPVASLATFLAVGGPYYFLHMQRLIPDAEFLRLLAAVFVVQNIVMFCGFFAEEADLDGRRLKPDLRQVSACLFGSEADWQPARSFTTLLQGHISNGDFQLAWRLSKDILLPVPQNAQIFAWFAVMNGKESVLELERLAEATLAGGKLDAAQSSWLLLARGACFAHRGRIDLAGECFAEAIEHSPDVGTKVAICDSVANLVISARLMDALPEALRLSEFALQLHPEELTLMGTLSSLLVEMGRIDEAEAILERVFRETQSGNDKAICAFYLALVNFRKGNIEAVRSWREKMMQHRPPKWLVARLGELDGREVAPDKSV